MDKMLVLSTGFLAALTLMVAAGTGYNYYRLDQMNERVLIDHAKHDEYSKRLDVLEGKKPQGKTGSLGSMGSMGP